MKDALQTLFAALAILAATLLFWHFCPPILDLTSLPSEQLP